MGFLDDIELNIHMGDFRFVRSHFGHGLGSILNNCCERNIDDNFSNDRDIYHCRVNLFHMFWHWDFLFDFYDDFFIDILIDHYGSLD